MRSIGNLLGIAPRRQWDLLPHDVRVGARLLTRSPGFSITAILTLALGIGGSASTFSMVYAVVPQPLAFPASERVVHLGRGQLENREPRLIPVSAKQFDAIRDRSKSFDLGGAMRRLRIVGSHTRFLAIADTQVLREPPGCQYNIVSSSVVSVYCSHRDGDAQVLDLLIAWRGQPGWFQHGKGTTGVGGQSGLGSRGVKGRVSQYAIYNGVTVAFDADFDARTVTIDGVAVSLESVNTILIDHVEQTEARQRSATLRIEPGLPLGQDVNLVLARRSRELREFLRCDLPMPVAYGPLPQTPVITVCEKLATMRR